MSEQRETLSAEIATLSMWIDDAQEVPGRPWEAVTWCRVAKIAEEAGELVAAYIGANGQNPRKGFTHTDGDVIVEALDCAVTALGIVEHLNGNDGGSVAALEAHVSGLMKRAGLKLTVSPSSPVPGTPGEREEGAGRG